MGVYKQQLHKISPQGSQKPRNSDDVSGENFRASRSSSYNPRKQQINKQEEEG